MHSPAKSCVPIRYAIIGAKTKARIEARETILVKENATSQIAQVKSPKCKLSMKNTAKAVATPFPPLNHNQIEKM